MDIKLDPMTKRQLKQFKRLKQRYFRRELAKHGIDTMCPTLPIKTKMTVYQLVKRKPKTAQFLVHRSSKTALQQLYDKHLKTFKCAVTATLLNNVFFNSYARAYYAVKKLTEMGLLVKRKNYYFVKQGR